MLALLWLYGLNSMLSSDVEEVDHDLADRLSLGLAFRLVEITVNLLSLLASETSAEALSPIVTDGVVGDLVGVLQVELVHHGGHFLNRKEGTLSLNSS
jgi:hypothetical protein